VFAWVGPDDVVDAGAEAVGVAGLLVVPPHPTDAAKLMTNAARIIPLIGFSFVGVTLPNRGRATAVPERLNRSPTVLVLPSNS
jgi:hypothetical protein